MTQPHSGNTEVLTGLVVPGAQPGLVLHETQPNRSSLRLVRVVYEGRHQRLWYPQPHINANQPLLMAMNSIRGTWERRAAQARLWYSLHATIWNVVVDIGNICTARLDDLESGPLEREVVIADRTNSPRLTALFHADFGREFLGSTDTLAVQYADVVVGSPSQKAIVVGFSLNKSMVLVFCIVGLLLGLLAGVVIGVKMSSIQIGFSVFAGFTTVIGVILGVFYWMNK